MSASDAVIFNDPLADPVTDRFSAGANSDQTVFVPAGDPDSAARAANVLVEEDGVQRIEVCGALGSQAAAAVLRATVDPIPVGVCTFGIESLNRAAAFDQKIGEGNQVSVAVLYVSRGADPDVDRVVTERGMVRMLFVPIADESAAAGVASRLVDKDGVDLVELYRGIGIGATAEVIKEIARHVPVGSTA